jgi:hypothetical protein
MKRLGIGIGAIFLIVVGSAPWAFAQGQKPAITSSAASFTILTANASETVWTLNLWANGNRVGTDSGTGGTLTVEVPPTRSCKFQADVLRNGKWYSGAQAVLTSCGGHTVPPTTTTTTTTSTTPVTSSRGGSKPNGGGKGKGQKAGTDPTPATMASNSDSPKATNGATPVSSSRLAFTGTGAGLWTLGLTGGVLILAGAPLALRRPKLRRLNR